MPTMSVTCSSYEFSETDVLVENSKYVLHCCIFVSNKLQIIS